MNEQEQDAIYDAIDFDDATKHGITAQVNCQNTVIKADSKSDIVKFLRVNISHHTIFTGQQKRDQFIKYPLFHLVMEGLDLAPPNRIHYKHERILIAEYDDFAIGIAPAI